MKRNTKNILMVSLIIIMALGIFLTINSVKSSNGNMGEKPPEMPNNQEEVKVGDVACRTKRKNNNKKDPEKRGEVKEDNFNNQKRPSMGNDTPPEMPNNMNSSLSTMHYVIFGFNSLVIALILMYLIMSKFNQKTFKETYSETDKIIIGILGSIIITGSLTYLSILLTNNYFLNNANMIDTNMPGNDNTNVSYSAKVEINSDEDITSGTYTSTNKEENAISVSGDVNVNLSNISVNKEGDADGGDSTSFYGTNSAIIAKDKAVVTIKDATITTNANGANGVFSYGGSATTNNANSDGTTINISDSEITTTKNNSGGIMTTGGGIMNATNLVINTSGTSSAAIRTDRGGGKVKVNKGTYKTTGVGSPSIYSTADVEVYDATLISTASEGVVIEGANSVLLNNCDLTDTNNKLNGQSTTYKNIFLYQSISGDAANGNSTFTSVNSNMTTNNGDSFYVTNTKATINLENNTIINNDNSGNFLRIKADSWGSSGNNGGDVTLNLTNQKVSGNIVVDNISTLEINMDDSSTFEGIINANNEAKSITLNITNNTKIKLLGDSYITALNLDNSSYSNIDFNGYKFYVNGKSIN